MRDFQTQKPVREKPKQKVFLATHPEAPSLSVAQEGMLKKGRKPRNKKKVANDTNTNQAT